MIMNVAINLILYFIMARSPFKRWNERFGGSGADAPVRSVCMCGRVLHSETPFFEIEFGVHAWARLIFAGGLALACLLFLLPGGERRVSRGRRRSYNDLL
jgi:hypothetical protein